MTNGKDASPSAVAERTPFHLNGLAALVLDLGLLLLSAYVFAVSMMKIDAGGLVGADVAILVAASLWLFIVGPTLFAGLKVVRPNEAMVFTLLGSYHGCLREPGFYFLNPLVSAVAPAASKGGEAQTGKVGIPAGGRKAISLKSMTLSNDKQKINDSLGNPLVIGIVVIWKVVDPTKAVLDVENYPEFLSIQCDAALRHIIRQYPYDSADEEVEKSIRGSSQEIASRLRDEIQRKVAAAGLEVLDAGITHLSYAPEIAAAMLQKQQASAMIAARQMIVEGAVGMVDMALNKLSEGGIVELDEERKASMVSNLLVVLCSGRDAQPVVNSGSIY